MKLKYYLRGLGIGIFVTALIMGITLGSKRELTDIEIKERALELGMVEESDVLLPTATVAPEPKVMEINQDNESERNVAATKIAAQVSAKIKSDTMIRESEDEVGVAGGTSKSEQTVGNANRTIATEPVVIYVESGNGSDIVSKKLVDAGLVENAETFDKYLCNRDYDYKIKIGKHTIPAGSTFDEIAHILISAAE